jgi:hypothetical protein
MEKRKRGRPRKIKTQEQNDKKDSVKKRCGINRAVLVSTPFIAVGGGYVI